MLRVLEIQGILPGRVLKLEHFSGVGLLFNKPGQVTCPNVGLRCEKSPQKAAQAFEAVCVLRQVQRVEAGMRGKRVLENDVMLVHQAAVLKSQFKQGRVSAEALEENQNRMESRLVVRVTLVTRDWYRVVVTRDLYRRRVRVTLVERFDIEPFPDFSAK